MATKDGFQLEEYLSQGVESIVKDILSASLKYPKASLFMAKYLASSNAARMKRKAAEKQGEHIPPFLIASITTKCNLHCKGCYARANQACTDACPSNGADGLLTGEDWHSIFTQAEELGVGFILLAGGEPFVRRDVLEQAGRHPSILFPIFTNGTLLDENHLRLLEQNRNLLPVISIEGDQQTTDARRGDGVFAKTKATMAQLKEKGILFGASVTVTNQNMEQVLSDAFLAQLQGDGVKAVIYVEYVPADGASQSLAPTDETRAQMMARLQELRLRPDQLLLIAFPGDEKASGGCLAAGRGFFHINATGGAEPCPFSPYSDSNVKATSLREALNSALFRRLRECETLAGEHIGGCVLFEQRDKVEALLKESAV